MFEASAGPLMIVHGAASDASRLHSKWGFFFFVLFNPAPPLLARVKFISGADYRSVVILAGSVKSS